MIRKPSTNRSALLLNGAVILFVGASLGVAVRSAVFVEQTPPCKTRFLSATRFSLDRDGAPISSADLQGQLSNTDWGLIDGTRVVALRSGPAPYALEFDLASAPAARHPVAGQRAGIGFIWAPQSFGRPTAACLAYSVFLPEGFTFGSGGRLPGLAGDSTLGEQSGGPKIAFSTRYTWSPDGEADILPQLPEWPAGRSLGGKKDRLTLEPGRWTELEQEVVLNTPGERDGVLRVWQDGRLVIERSDVVFRSKPSARLVGVLAETASGQMSARAPAGQQRIWLTPFELHWQ